MSEICLECFKKDSNSTELADLKDKVIVLSDDLDLCEGCAKIKQVVVTIKKEKGSFRHFATFGLTAV